MSPIHILQLFIFSLCINLFAIFTYFIYLCDIFSSKLFDELQTHYDFIIIGSGTAGSLIAQRIARETNYSFIVLEAGATGHSFLDIPAFGPLLHNSIYDWQYETVPQKMACLAMKESKCKQTQGKILGGSSKLNNMIHVRGNISHYVEWFHGLYDHKHIQDSFEYIENNVFHLNNIQYKSHLSDAVINAAKELNFSILGYDFGFGFKKSILTQKDGKRWTASDNVDKKHIFTNVFVEKLKIKNNNCIGVQISPQSKNIYAKKGVIVSAGTYNSAKILQLSGIGPIEVLSPLGIPVVKDLPVGKNLQDHIGTGLDLVLFSELQSVGMLDIMNPSSVLQYFLNGKGPLTTPGCEAVGFISTKNESTPNLQYMVLPVGISADRGSRLRKNLGITDKVWNGYFSKIFDKYSATFLTLLLHPKSKGEIRIQSKDPYLSPLIDPKYLNYKDDVKVIIEGLKIVEKIVNTNAMKNLSAQLNKLTFPGCENFEFFSDLYLECYIRHLTLTSFHPVGTCAMGLPDSKHSVVDTSFKVIGVNNLFVADASVLPTLPSGNINAAVAMMANVFFENTIAINKNLHCDNVTFKEAIYNVCLIK